jgi:hypothetical protein
MISRMILLKLRTCWFVNANSDESYVDRNFKKEELTHLLTVLHSLPNLYHIRTIFYDNSYRMVRLIETGMVPDSVKHDTILFSRQIKQPKQ